MRERSYFPGFFTALYRCDLTLTLSPLEAHRFVKPDRLGEPPVEWWKVPRTRRTEGALRWPMSS